MGNVRVSYAKDATTGNARILEESHYYPFGLKHANYNSYVHVNTYNYKYNGKELQEELGLNMYDYGARNYDPAIGRWMNMDPLAENHHENTPYMYANNNPIIFIDPDGRDFTAQDFARGLQRQMKDSETKDTDNDCPSCRTKEDWNATSKLKIRHRLLERAFIMGID